MKIGLIGAPGSGKSNLAAAIYDTFGLPVIDDYVHDVESRSGWVLGRYATYAGNIAVALDRRFREQEKESHITCGTMLDTVTYEAAKAYVAEDEADRRRWSGALVVLGCMVEDMMDYDLLFFLPSEPEDEYLARVANGLEEAVEVFEADYTVLDQPTFEERVEAAFVVLRANLDKFKRTETHEATSAE